MKLYELLDKRRATRYFDPMRKLEREKLEEIIKHALLSPSGFNLQSWRFIAVESEKQKEKLFECAFNQDKVKEASVVLICCGDLECHKDVNKISADMVAKNYMPPEAEVGFIKMVKDYYANPQRTHDSIFRDVMLASMVTMMAAMEAGVDSAPMSGFDVAKVKEAFNLPENITPVLLLALGYARKSNPERGVRKKLADVLHYEEWE